MIIISSGASPDQHVNLARNKQAQLVIILPDHPSVPQEFAGTELAKYLQKISGAKFSIEHHNVTGQAIRLERTNGENEDAYGIAIRNHDIILSGNSDRAILFAVYDFLGRLGCLWLAPDFHFYSGAAETIPHKEYLTYNAIKDIKEQPKFIFRKIAASGSRIHSLENLAEIINWMPKLRFNTLMIPMDGKMQWDKLRGQLIQELKKRDLIIEVGQHGYQYFLNANMENGTLFKKHPDWFGKDSSCKASPSGRLVFNTENPGALHYFINNIVRYNQQHPEINIFDFWPPDGAHWADCSSLSNKTLPGERQAWLANMIDSAIKKIHPAKRLEIIAYEHVLLPPGKVKLNKDILVDFCPIDQSFEKQIYDSTSDNNVNYIKALQAWHHHFSGDVGLYSYYRKAAWRSLPNIIPHYMQRDMKWYSEIPLKGISSAARSEDWFTYELNHYVVGHLAWNPNVNVDSLINDFCHARYGTAWKTAKAAFGSLENIVPVYSSIPFTKLKSKKLIMQAQEKINVQILALQEEKKESHITVISDNLSRLLLMFQYVSMNLQIQEARAENASREVLEKMIGDLLAFLSANEEKGLFLLSGKNNWILFMKHYGLTTQSLLGL